MSTARQLESVIEMTSPVRAAAAEETAAYSPKSFDYYPWFDWLRIVLACAVMLSHDGLINQWNQSGNFAVQVFFALSGWLIGGMLLNLSSVDLPRFYFNRALRIWCPYFLALGILLAVAFTRDHLSAKWGEFVLYKVTFVYNLFGPPQLAQHSQDMPLSGTGNHFWSVNAEEQFYLLAPLVLVLAPSRYGRSVTVWVGIAIAAWLTATYASIVFGVLAALLAHRYGPYHTNGWVRSAFGAVAAASALCMVAGVKYELAAPICSVGLVLLFAAQGAQHSLGALVGGMSYPLYLNHWIGIFVFHGIFKHLGLMGDPVADFARHALSLGFSLGLAAYLYLHFDRRILANRARIYTRRRGQTAIVVAYAMIAIGICLGMVLSFYRG
jgi:peptidoglycan/LPS O-acetylase OafA/YrhL